MIGESRGNRCRIGATLFEISDTPKRGYLKTSMAPQHHHSTMTANNIKPIPPDQAQDIQRAFEELDGRLKVSGKHPTLTTRGSLMIDHADGTRSHFSYKRPMTLDEVERTHTGLGASARKRTLMQKLIFWR